MLRWLVISAFVVALPLGGCVENPARGGSEFSLLSEEQEYKIGRDNAAQLIEEFGGTYKEFPALNDYVQARARDIIRVSERADKPADVRVLNSPIINAAALPGYIVVNRGILPYFNSEAEMMAVLGHEVGHVTARHTASRITTGTLVGIGSMIAQIAIGEATGSQQAVDLTGQATGLLGAAGIAAYGRGQELEADELGLRYMTRLCYDGTRAAEVFGMFARKRDFDNYIRVATGIPGEEKTIYHQVLSTHPDDARRYADLSKKAAQVEKPCGQLVHRERFMNAIDGLAFGPTTKDGFGARGVYYDAGVRMTFKVPEGFYFYNEQGLPLATRVGQDVFINGTAFKHDPDADTDVMLMQMDKGINSIKNFTAGDVVGSTGVQDFTNQQGQKRRARVVLFKSSVPQENGKGTYVLLTFSASPQNFAAQDDVFFEITNSIRTLSKAQADALQPLRVRAYIVRAGDTAAKLAEKIPFGHFREDWFRMLNALPPGTDVKTGDVVKLIADPNR